MFTYLDAVSSMPILNDSQAWEPVRLGGGTMGGTLQMSNNLVGLSERGD
jgi:hypothetical protein